MIPDPPSARQPDIVAPVMRYLGVSDTARSAAFYRDVLGFEIRDAPDGIEAACGPALLHFDTQAFASAIVFFQTGDVAAMHAAVRARGGRPSEIEKVNWIKMRMFEIRDPDGNTLWFGQSYHVPDSTPTPRMFQKALPELPLDDIPGGIAHYRDVLGFHVDYQDPNIGVMDRDAVTLLLIARTERHAGIGSAYVYVENADQLYAELRAKGADVQGEPVSHPWGLRDFCVRDLDRNEIRFGQPFE